MDDDYLVEDVAVDQSNGNLLVTLKSSDGFTRVDLIRVTANSTYRRTVLNTRRKTDAFSHTTYVADCLNMPRSVQVSRLLSNLKACVKKVQKSGLHKTCLSLFLVDFIVQFLLLSQCIFELDNFSTQLCTFSLVSFNLSVSLCVGVDKHKDRHVVLA